MESFTSASTNAVNVCWIASELKLGSFPPLRIMCESEFPDVLYIETFPSLVFEKNTCG